ncbi:MAG: hypothetical protein PHF60_00390 [Candidatus ainarchaeum sp.]|nr:hypothetical protein [Candidatus ainarchaeum sp.]
MEGKKEEHGHEVKCSFCGNDTTCERCMVEPASAAGSEHICYDCYQKMAGQLPENIRDRTHICIPPEKMQENFERFLNETTERAFVQLWDSEKKKLKEMSRQDLSRASFFEGARFMFSFMQQMSQEEQKHEHGHEHKHEGHGHEEHGHEHKHEHKHEEKK